MKFCSRCQTVAEFGPNKGRSDGLQSYCRTCTRETHKEWRDANADHCRTYARVRNNFKRHGLLEDTVRGFCQVCGEFGTMCRDHDHECCPAGSSCASCRRGLLCRACNVTLGQVEDSTDRLRALADYLEASRASA